MGVQVALLTGDSEAVAKAVVIDLGIDTYLAQVLLENTEQNLIEQQKQGKRMALWSAMAGRMRLPSRAGFGIANINSTDVAVQSAGIIQVKPDLLDLIKIIHHPAQPL